MIIIEKVTKMKVCEIYNLNSNFSQIKITLKS